MIKLIYEKMLHMEQDMQGMKQEIQGIKQDMNHHLQKINERFDVLELRESMTQKKLDDLSLDTKISERNIQKSIHHLDDEMETVIEILKQNNLVGIA